MSTLSREVVGELTARLLEYGMIGTREALLDHDASQRAEIARLTAERDEARKDSTRLDWLDLHPGSIEPRANGSTWVAKIGTGYLIAEVRDLIDSAMEQEKRK